MGRNDVSDHEYPPQKLLSSILCPQLIQHLTVVRIGGLVGLFVASIELLRPSGFTNTPIPFNYPFFLNIILIILVLYVLQSMHSQLDDAKSELVVLSRISENRSHIPEEDVPDEKDIYEIFESRFDWAFSPFRMITGAVIFGTIAIAVMHVLEVLDAYPYILMNFLYGASHGLLLPFLFIIPPLLKIVPERFMNDLNSLDPTGAGGYPAVGESIAKGAWFGTILVNIDFLILGSVGFLSNIVFQIVVIAVYLTELVLLFGFTLAGTFRIRNVLKEVRDKQVRQLQWEFGINEGIFLADDFISDYEINNMMELITYILLFERLKEMDLWPINLFWWTRLIGSVLATTLVIVIQLIVVIDVAQIINLIS